MEKTRRNKENLGIDTNILVAYLDKKHPDNPKTKELTQETNFIYLSPTVIHETYHTLVYAQKWRRKKAEKVLNNLINIEDTKYLEQNKNTTKLGLKIANKYEIGGRDSQIISTLLGKTKKLITLDKELLNHKKIKINNKTLKIKKPKHKTNNTPPT